MRAGRRRPRRPEYRTEPRAFARPWGMANPTDVDKGERCPLREPSDGAVDRCFDALGRHQRYCPKPLTDVP